MRFVVILSVALGAVLFAACGGDDNAKTSTPTAARTATSTAAATSGATATIGGPAASGSAFVVNAILRDYSITRNPGSGEAGPFEFQISNTGPSKHEFVVVKTDLAAEALPTDSDGAVKEGEVHIIAEHEPIDPGSTEKLQATLDAGHYVFFCNIVEQGGGGAIAHYTQGMRRDFTVQ